jgi:hypothetical protein
MRLRPLDKFYPQKNRDFDTHSLTTLMRAAFLQDECLKPGFSTQGITSHALQ